MIFHLYKVDLHVVHETIWPKYITDSTYRISWQGISNNCCNAWLHLIAFIRTTRINEFDPAKFSCISFLNLFLQSANEATKNKLVEKFTRALPKLFGAFKV